METSNQTLILQAIGPRTSAPGSSETDSSDIVVDTGDDVRRRIRKKQRRIIVTCLVIIGILVALGIATQGAQGNRAIASVTEVDVFKAATPR